MPSADASAQVEEEQLVQSTLDSAMEETQEAENEPPISKSRNINSAISEKAANKPQPRPGIILGVPRPSREEVGSELVRMAAKGSRKGAR